nr:pantoate--beta-alanine ligase [Corynebacterium capitovis]
MTAAALGQTGPVVLVPTMGALHEGHADLVREAKRVPDGFVVVSIFVNPLQFGAGEDLDAYPRTLEADVEKLSALGADAVFAPSVAEMYPAGPRTTVHPGPLGEELEGAARPTHFAGVLTVVTKLLRITRCTHAVFGEKDYQQLQLVRQLVSDLDLGVHVIGVPIARAESGLALSSRNRYLSDSQAREAAILSAALREGAAHHDADAVLAAARAVVDSVPEIEIDYLELRSAELGEPRPGKNRLLIAARVGGTRLLDNIEVTL